MKCETVMILWHNKDPIYSVDFHPTTNKFCTTGFDNEIKIWSYTKDKEGHLSIEYLSSLTKHTKPVNVARFSPGGNLLASGSDDGSVVIWKLTSINNPTNDNTKFNPTDVSFMKETWSIVSILRVTTDVYDLSWSLDGLYLTTVSTDNSISIWNPLTKTHQQLITEHSHYVQGVSWDPLNEYMITQSSDGTCRIYRNEKKKKQKSQTLQSTVNTPTTITDTTNNNNEDNINDKEENNKKDNNPTTTTVPTPIQSQQSDIQPERRKKLHLTIANVLTRRYYNKDQTNINSNDDEEETKITTKKSNNRMDIDGEPDETTKSLKDESLVAHRMYYDERASTFFRRPTWSPDGLMFITTTGKFKESPTSKYISTSYIFSRYIRDRPIVHLPADSPTVVAKFSPIIYKLREQQQPEQYENDNIQDVNSNSFKNSSTGNKLFNLNYRMIYAISSTDSVIIYDTQQTRKPIAVVSNLHYSAITDISWSSDGLVLIITSSDGFCSYISFQPNELGEPLSEHEQSNIEQFKETLILKQRAILNTTISNDSIDTLNNPNNKKRKNEDSNENDELNDTNNNNNNHSNNNEQNKKQKLENESSTEQASTSSLNNNNNNNNSSNNESGAKPKRRIQPNLIKKS
ncbi:hypothetical protein DICPUDRAFT_89123 [Dictyostelium purpureum]|uniref:CAF1B/HIR1 beta-propeller domain-containing protein n=1 Tax=Dictyostelium purpureum TaxID=5786 RepID=F0ZTU7_DICPU|nr:uncharacterized protein DICPUDRAFT_89123 [Dictyostelium purpureum]EGC32637.1 hypothetical protein DICPUDRAFT_89123 [Dictyostelium purpureum]|eukprot:XP_003290852.1 hypothetical protein DICPUDRAFT_89123 [Dictyostelium purpureum]